MKTTLLKNIKTLWQVGGEDIQFRAGAEMKKLPAIQNAFLVIKDDKIHDYGEMQNLDPAKYPSDTIVRDLQGKMVLPAFCDSHTHLVYAGSREKEYIDKIRGLSYEEIAKRGGGILNSARLLNETSEDSLYEQSVPRIHEIMSGGTGAVEIKSGYGLNTESELKMLRVIRRIKEDFPLEVKATFLGAHAVPEKYKAHQAEYVDHIINEMIPVVASENLADYIDVFCDRGFFTVEDTERILMAGIKYGLRAKIHANELDYSGGIQTGVKYDALSVDHLEYTGPDEIKTLLGSETMPTLLPGASFFLEMPYAPARKMIDSGLPVSLASDFNPGSSPSGNMELIMSLALVKQHMLPEEIVNAVTVNAAYAMGLDSEMGSISRGKYASILITKELSSLEFIPYSYGSSSVEEVIIKGLSI